VAFPENKNISVLRKPMDKVEVARLSEFFGNLNAEC
jgi:hypothetical protein